MESNIYKVSVSCNDGGKVKVNEHSMSNGSEASFEEGTKVNIIAIPKKLWAIVKASDEYKDEKLDIKEQLEDGKNYVISTISTDHAINVEFNQAYYLVSTKVNGKGTIIPEGNNPIERERKCVLTFAPEYGYKISKVDCNGEDITKAVIENGGVYTVNFIESGWYISASFIKDTPVPPRPTPTPTPEDKKNAEILTKLTEPFETTMSKAEELLANGQKDEAFNELVLADIIKRRGLDTFVGELI